jgi:hypothetical protein
MDKRVETADGRTIFIHVDDEVVSAGDAPPIESNIDDPEEGATEAMILVDPAPNTMTMEGAIAGIGKVMRHRFGGPGHSPQPGHWFTDWGVYVLVGLLMGAVFLGKIAGLF